MRKRLGCRSTTSDLKNETKSHSTVLNRSRFSASTINIRSGKNVEQNTQFPHSTVTQNSLHSNMNSFRLAFDIKRHTNRSKVSEYCRPVGFKQKRWVLGFGLLEPRFRWCCPKNIGTGTWYDWLPPRSSPPESWSHSRWFAVGFAHIEQCSLRIHA